MLTYRPFSERADDFARFLDELPRNPVRLAARWGVAIPHVDSATATRTATGGVAVTASRSEQSSDPGADSSRSGSTSDDWDRLERAVEALVARNGVLQDRLRELRGGMVERDHRIRALEAQLLEANQRRQDTAKRIDELISQLDQLDAQLASTEPNA